VLSFVPVVVCGSAADDQRRRAAGHLGLGLGTALGVGALEAVDEPNEGRASVTSHRRSLAQRPRLARRESAEPVRRRRTDYGERLWMPERLEVPVGFSSKRVELIMGVIRL